MPANPFPFPGLSDAEMLQLGTNGVATHEMAGNISVSSLALDGCRIYVGFLVVISANDQQATVLALDGCGNIGTAVEGMRVPPAYMPYPNPADDQVRVQLLSSQEHIRIHDALGRSISVPFTIANGSAILELGSVPNGVYTLSTDHGRTSRLVVQH